MRWDEWLADARVTGGWLEGDGRESGGRRDGDGTETGGWQEGEGDGDWRWAIILRDGIITEWVKGSQERVMAGTVTIFVTFYADLATSYD